MSSCSVRYHVRHARLEDLNALPQIERAANGLFATVGLAEQLSDILPSIESLREGLEPAHGRQGFGTALVETVCNWARAAGYRAMTWTTLRHIAWNAPWYQQLGFRLPEEMELSQPLRDLMPEETHHGLSTDQRVAMHRELYSNPYEE